ncbi:uncharacterized protein LOC125033053 [Penaeus chinensis]|uniref:uncharacterized protein LOC125033053 n=1 Tax=Penaeus chinensis TaxID=139456 RepID=UPI001FB7D04E|nr:uncharacterized protein LOC125033053 [Penaeus chinensis]XP_047480448.1 uncharacterized protein LOC125033053 [Penaeus chinensis]
MMTDTVFLGLFFLSCLSHVECTPKAACNETDACQPVTEECVNGVCECQKNHDIELTAGLEILRNPAPACTPDCEDNKLCIDGHCHCDRGRVYVSDRCRSLEGFREFCSSSAFLCDISANLSCSNSTCLCLETHWFDPDTNSCRHKNEFLAEYNVTEYKVHPGIYCRTSDDCITGLHCKNFFCKCPKSCEYKRDKEVCDCGEAEVSVTWPIIVGILLGIIIIWFWVKAVLVTLPD